MTQHNDADGVKRFKWEYRNFLTLVRERNVEKAMLYTQMLGIDRRTLVHWLSQPELHDALMECVDEMSEGMKRAGSKDWRMWRELMNIMGIKDIKEVDIKSGGEKLQPATVIDLGGKLDATDKPEAEQNS